MRKGLSETVTTMLWVATTVILILIVFSIGTKLVPLIYHGTCWGGLSGSVDNLIKGPSALILGKSTTKITMGDCVGALMFLNYDEAKEIVADSGGYIKCHASKASVIGIPSFKDTSFGFNPLNWPKAAWNRVTKYWGEEVRGIQPICVPMDKEVSVEPTGMNVIEGTRDGTSKYICVRLEDRGTYYKIKIEELASGDDECK